MNKKFSMKECKELTKEYDPSVDYTDILESILIHKKLIEESTEDSDKMTENMAKC
jgi:hypothetical protein|tara:strand:+ start:983 stop:1147 length:165 start_codon:yes stop_codon:yes gene_type:complete